MNHLFPPNIQRGMIIHTALAIGSTAVMAASILWIANNAIDNSNIAWLFANLFLILAFGTVTAYFCYRMFGLYRAKYELDRNFLQINWGMRFERVPVSDIEWVKHISHFKNGLSLPFLHFTGSITGEVQQEGLGNVEFLASEAENMVLIGTPKKIFAISPADLNQFLAAVNRIFEMGTLEVNEGHSVYPPLALTSAWKDTKNQTMWIFTLLANLAFLGLVLYLLPGINSIILSASTANIPQEPVPGQQLLLLPLLSFASSFIGFLLGLYLYQDQKMARLAQLIWGASPVATIFLIFSLFFILPTGN